MGACRFCGAYYSYKRMRVFRIILLATVAWVSVSAELSSADSVVPEQEFYAIEPETEQLEKPTATNLKQVKEEVPKSAHKAVAKMKTKKVVAKEVAKFTKKVNKAKKAIAKRKFAKVK